MALNKVDLCGKNTSKLPLLSNEEKEQLFIQMEQGDPYAREHLIEGNLRLVLSVIQRFSGNSECADDLFQIGCIGLMKAIDNFDRSLNVRFSTYAVPMIMGEVRRSLRDIAYKAIYAKEQFLRIYDKEPTIEELAEAVGSDKETLTTALDAISSPLSLYEPVYQDGGDHLYLMDQVRDKKCTEDAWLEEISLKEAVKRLPEREKDIIRLRFFEGRTQTEVAEEISISQAQVSRLEKGALRHMKKYLSGDHFSL